MRFLFSPCPFSQILSDKIAGKTHYEAWFTNPDDKRSRRLVASFSLDECVREIDRERGCQAQRKQRHNAATRKALGIGEAIGRALPESDL